MKKLSLLISFIVVINLNAVTMNELFNAVKQQPATKIDELSSKIAKIAENKVKAGYYPEANLFANYTHYNSPTNLRPLDPLAAAKLIAKNEPLPFSNTIEQIGVGVSIPIFVKELSDLSNKAKYLAKSVRLKKELNFYQKEALVLGANASLEYLDNLVQTLRKTKKSLQKTRNDLAISVNSGRMPGVSLDKIDEKLNLLDISINNLFIKKATLVSTIETLTGLEIKVPAKMHLVTNVRKGEFFALKPLKEVINASNSALEASVAKRYYPKVSLNLMWSENYAQDDVIYGNSVHRGYGYYRLGVSMPLYSRGEDVDMQLKKVEIIRDRMKLKRTEQELESQAKALEKELILLSRSKKLKKLNIQKREDLLRFAKLSFSQGRMSEEDYLVYEDKVLSAMSSYYETVSQKWQVIAKLAVIYGNDLRGVVR